MRTVRIDCAPWRELWPDLAISLWVTQPGAVAAYPAVIKMEGDVLIWLISEAATSIAGYGLAQIMGLAEGQRKLSATVKTCIRESIVGEMSDPPEAAQPWVDKVLDAPEPDPNEQRMNEIEAALIELAAMLGGDA